MKVLVLRNILHRMFSYKENTHFSDSRQIAGFALPTDEIPYANEQTCVIRACPCILTASYWDTLRYIS